tara:strand:+ start:19 stop:696 length:678 start_codon:yes stop_codon:yes gene_type:complete
MINFSKSNCILLVVLSIIIALYVVNYFYLTKNNNQMEILQKDKVSKGELNDILRNKLPLIITGEVEDWYIFKEDDTIDNNKLTHKILKENANKLIHNLAVGKKFTIENYSKRYHTKIVKEINTRHFFVVLEGDVRILLFNPEQESKIEFIEENGKKESKYSMFKKHRKRLDKLKYLEIKLDQEKLIYIPYNWLYCFYIKEPSLILDINSESIFTLPIKLLNDRLQ